MKTQELFPFDSFFYGINNFYIPLEDNHFLVNGKGILAPNKILVLGKFYLLIMPIKTEWIIKVIKLEDVYMNNDEINLVIHDSKANERFILKLALPELKGTEWLLIDESIVPQVLEKLSVIDYCNSY